MAVVSEALDKQGLAYLWSKMKQHVTNEITNNINTTPIIPVNPATEPTENGAIWITTN